jgi:two-component system sensor histidine kinase/response regulator
MNSAILTSEAWEAVGERAEALFEGHADTVRRRTDRLFVVLLELEWLAAMVVALWISPRAWAGTLSRTHIHVWAALGLGGAIVSVPIALAWLRPGTILTRHLIAVGQVLMGVLLIHLTGGRIETHFHVFGSLAFLSLYRDWRVLVSASAVVAVDHLLRGIYWPQSVFGVLVASPWRWLEHAGWVIFEDAVLIPSCLQSLREMREIAWRRAELEVTREQVERTVEIRSAQLVQANNELRMAEQRFEAFMDHSPIIAFTIDQEGRLVYLNRQSNRIFGEAPGDRLGKTLDELFPAAVAAQLRETNQRVLEAGAPLELIETIPTADGRPTQWLSFKFPFQDATGRTFLGGTAIDLSDRLRTEEDLRRAKEVAEAANRAKSEFLTNMSHEIRTPMNGIVGMTELALDTNLSPHQREYLELVRSSAESLMEVINEILDFSKVEAGQLTLDPVPFSLREMIEETLHTLAVRAHGKGLELACRLAPEVPEAVIGDPIRLRQVLVNLVGNAIKFTEQGEIVVTVESDGPPDPTAEEFGVAIAVADTGIGIPPEKVAAVFEPFVQADGSTTRKYGGTGLGLAISTRLVHLMGGRIEVESERDRGSTFRFTLRLRHAQPGPPVPDTRRLAGVPILVVDDNATNRRILAEVLTNWGAHASLASDGPSALDALRSAQARGEPFALALLDGMMPGMDGFDLAAAIRSEPVGDDLALMLLSSSASFNDPERLRGLRIAACLLKPVRQSELFNALMALWEPQEQDGPSGQSLAKRFREDSRPPGRCLRVLLVEDHPVNQKVASRMLEGLGHRVTSAANGRQALETLEANQFDVVLMDVQMPEMDGFEAVAAIRRRELSLATHLPVIALTAHAMKGDRERCLAAGFDHYLAKPIRAEELRQVLESLNPTTDEETPRKPTQELDRLYEICGQDTAFVHELIGSFLESVPGLLAGIDAALSDVDWRRLASEAHGLKGICLTLGLNELARHCQTLEAAGRCAEADLAHAAREAVYSSWEHARAVLEEHVGIPS